MAIGVDFLGPKNQNIKGYKESFKYSQSLKTAVDLTFVKHFHANYRQLSFKFCLFNFVSTFEFVIENIINEAWYQRVFK